MNMLYSSNLKVTILGTLTLVALGMYFAVTQFATPVEQELMRDSNASLAAIPTSVNQDSAASLAPVDELLVGLEQRLEKQPDDVDGWILLSKSYYHLNRWKEAKEVFEKAKGLGYTGSWKPLPRIDSYSQNNFSSQSLNSSISFKNNKIREDVALAKNQSSDTFSQAGSTQAAGLKLKISLNPALKQELSPESPVFIFVRAAENPGPPLAVVRKEVDELPFELVLNDSHAMMPGRTISSAEHVIVGARISLSGNPERRSGDYEQLSKSIPSNTSKTVELVINHKI